MAVLYSASPAPIPARFLGLVLLLLVAIATPATAVTIYGMSAAGNLNESRNVDGGGLSGFNQYSSANSDLTLTWDVTSITGGWHYEYTFTNVNMGVSHIVLDLSDDCDGEEADEVASDCVFNAKYNGALIADSNIKFADQEGIAGSVKFDPTAIDGSVVYEFDSLRAPVWGHLAVKDGGGSGTCANAISGSVSSNVACSDSLFLGGADGTIADFVVRPNGAFVPEPTTSGLLGLGLLALAAARRRHPA